MIEIIVLILGLATHNTRVYVPKQMFPYMEECQNFANNNIRGAQRLADKLSKEKTQVTLQCRVRPYHKA